MPKAKKKVQRNSPISRKQPKPKGVKSKTANGHDKEPSMARDILATVLKEYTKNANKTKAVQMKQYMRGQFEFFGIQAPLLKEIGKRVLSGYPTLSRQCVIDIVKLSYEEPQREVQHFGVEVAKKYKRLLAGADATTCLDGLEVAKFMVVNKSWWDTVDMIASHIVAELAQQEPNAVNKILDKWIEDENMWLRRTAILHQLLYKDKTDADRLFRYCLKRCHEKEFFIQKAIGWALRQHYKTDKNAVKKFVKENSDKLAPLSKREALKHD